MINKELRNKLLIALDLELSHKGYVMSKSQGEFTKKSVDGWEKFQLIFLIRGSGWEINPAMMIRKNEVENIYHKTSFFEAKYHKTTPTVGITVENFINDGDEHRLILTCETDIFLCKQQIMKLFSQIVEPFFCHYSSIEEIEKEINIENRVSIFKGPKYEGCLGIILARIVKNPNYKHLEEKYRKYYEWFSNGFYMPEYEGVLNTLNSLNV